MAYKTSEAHPRKGIPYHGGAPLHAAVRRIIENTPLQAGLEMSVPIMEAQLVADGMDAALAHRLASQVLTHIYCCRSTKLKLSTCF